MSSIKIRFYNCCRLKKQKKLLKYNGSEKFENSQTVNISNESIITIIMSERQQKSEFNK